MTYDPIAAHSRLDGGLQVDTGRERSGAGIVLEALERRGVEVVFGFPGGTVLPLYDELLRHSDRLRHVLVRHEQGAVHAAAAYARVSGRTGVAVATSGPGASNLLTGLMDAHLDSTPLVVIAGQVATSMIGRDAFQECDMMGMTNPITKHNFQPRSVNQLEEMIEQAFYIAGSGRPGPVYIDLPKDVQAATTLNGRAGPLDLPFYTATRPVDGAAVRRAAILIRSASRPLLLLGQGALHANAAAELGALAHGLDMPVTTTIMAKGVFDEHDPLSVGCLGMHGRRSANYAVAECDLLVAFGCRFSDRITGDTASFAAGKSIIHVDIDPYEIGKNVPAHVGLNCDARAAARALAGELDSFRPSWSSWSAHLRRLRGVCLRCVPDQEGGALSPKRVMLALNRVLADDDVVTTGVGQHQMFASHYLLRSRPRTFITSGGAGTMGFGLPAAVGAAVARPDATVWAIDGDGSLQMTVQELATLRAAGGKVVVMVIDNGYLGMVRQWQELYCNRRYSGVELARNPDFVQLAAAYGLPARRAADLRTLEEALAEARSSEGSMLLHVPVDRGANIMPMVPPGGRIADFCGYCISKPGRFFTSDEEAAEADSGGGPP